VDQIAGCGDARSHALAQRKVILTALTSAPPAKDEVVTTADPQQAQAKKKPLLPLILGALVLLAAVAVPVAALDHFVNTGVAVAFLLGAALFGPVRFHHLPRTALLVAAVAGPVVALAGLLGDHAWALAALIAVTAFVAGWSACWALHTAIVFIPIAAAVLATPVPLETAAGQGLALFVGAAYGIGLLGVLKVPSTAVETPVPRQVAVFYGAVLAILSGIATFGVASLHLEHGYWVTLTVLAVVQPSLTTSRRRAFSRVAGTTVGALAAVVFASLVTNSDVLLGVGMIFAVASLALARSYAVKIGLMTVALVTLAGGHAGAASIASQRFGLTLIGGIAVLAVCLFLPAVVHRLYPP